MSETAQKPKISIKEVFKEATLLYYNNAGLFLKISFLGILCDIIISNINYLLIPLPGIIALIIMPLLYYCRILLIIALYIAAASRDNGKEIHVKTSLVAAKNCFWNYIKVDIQLFLIIFIPAMAIFLIYRYIETVSVKWTFISLSAIPILYLMTVFIFAPLLAILQKGDLPYFEISKELVKGYFWPTLLLIPALFLIIQGSFQAFLHLYQTNNALWVQTEIVLAALRKLYMLFITPFFSLITVVVFYKLLALKKAEPRITYLFQENQKNQKTG